jgi:hypothetical protein
MQAGLLRKPVCKCPNAQNALRLCFTSISYTSDRIDLAVVVGSIVVFAGLFFLFFFALLLLAFAVAFLGLQVLVPKLVGGVAVDVGEDDLEDVRVPGYGLALDAFFDVLVMVSICNVFKVWWDVPLVALANRSCCPAGR